MNEKLAQYILGFYKSYAPDNMPNEQELGKMMEDYRGEHQTLIRHLHNKYRPNVKLSENDINGIISRHKTYDQPELSAHNLPWYQKANYWPHKIRSAYEGTRAMYTEGHAKLAHDNQMLFGVDSPSKIGMSLGVKVLMKNVAQKKAEREFDAMQKEGEIYGQDMEARKSQYVKSAIQDYDWHMQKLHDSVYAAALEDAEYYRDLAGQRSEVLLDRWDELQNFTQNKDMSFTGQAAQMGTAAGIEYIQGALSSGLVSIAPAVLFPVGFSFMTQLGEVNNAIMSMRQEELGLTPEEQIAMDFDNKFWDYGAAIVAASLDFIGAVKVAGVFKKGILKNYVTDVFASAAVEGATEWTQAMVTDYGAMRSVGISHDEAIDDIKDHMDRYKDDAIAGFLSGGFLGGGSSAFRRIRAASKAAKKARQLDDNEKAAP
jgi:hypothetical protein